VEETAAAFTISWAEKPRIATSADLITRSPQFFRGLIASDWSDPTHVKRWKIDHPGFVIASNLRKNMPHMHLSYLAADLHERDQMKIVFSEHQGMFSFIDNVLGSFAQLCYQLYVDAFIRHRFTAREHPMYAVLRKVHRRYKTSGTRVTLKDVEDTIRELPVAEVDAHLRNFNATVSAN
jgi:hypothetical protein